MVFLSSTYEAVSQWTEETQIEYLRDAKKGNTKSAERYERYAKAQTIGEALKLGSKPEDLLHDYERKFLKVICLNPTGAPEAAKEEMTCAAETQATVQPMTSEQTPEVPFHSDMGVEAAVSGGKLTGEVGSDLRARQEKMQRTILLAESIGLDLGEAKYLREGSDTIEQMAERLVADRMAQMILEKCEEENRRVTNKEVVTVMQVWAFKKNETRLNVMPEGQTYVHSDTLGLVRHRTGCFCVTQTTQQYPHVTQLLNTWLKARCPPEMGVFPATSISVNWNYAAKRHRDGNNAGPSMIQGFGSYTGGELAYWADDNHTTSVEDLCHDDRLVVDISKGLVLFDGLRAHEVDAFEGERCSVVFFSVGKFWQMTPEQRDYLEQCGFHVPEGKDMGPVRKFLPPPRGYTKCKSLTSMFGMREKARIYQWPNTSDSDEEAKADSLIAKFSSQADAQQVAKAAAIAVRLVKEKVDGPKEVPEEAVDPGLVISTENSGKDDKDEPSIAEMPQVKFGPLDQVFGHKKDSKNKEVEVPCSPPPKQRWTSEDMPKQNELSGEKRRLGRPRKVFDDRLPSKRPRHEELHLKPMDSSSDVTPALSSVEGQPESEIARGQCDTARTLVQALKAYHIDGSTAALTNFIRHMLFTSNDLQRRLSGILRLLASPKPSSQESLAALAAEVFSPEDSREVLQFLQSGEHLARHSVLSALGHAFALTQPPSCGASNLPGAEDRLFATAEGRRVRLMAMERAVVLGFGELGGAYEELLEALLADCGPAQLYPRCAARCGTPFLPMQHESAEDSDVALLRMTGAAVALEGRYAGTRVQVHKLGDCIALYGPDQEDMVESLDTAELVALRTAIKMKACVVEAVLRPKNDDGMDGSVQAISRGARVMAFDCVWQSGRSLTRQSLHSRREALARAIQPCSAIDLVPQEVFSIEDPPTMSAMAAVMSEAVSCNCTGLLVKRLDSEYEAGCTSRSWLAVTPPTA